MSNNNGLEAKTYCLKNECGPAKLTGFHINQYFVCSKCKEEVTKQLADQINNKEDNTKSKDTSNDDIWWGLP